MDALSPLPLSPSLPFSPAAIAMPHGVRPRAVDRRVRALRAARVAFGATLVAGGLALPGNALLDTALVPASTLIGVSWLAALVAALVAGTATLFAPMAGRLEDRWLIASWAWPLAGLALLLPLSMHSLVLVGGAVSELDKWVGLSWAIVGHCHVALALMAARRVERIVHGERALTGLHIYGVTIGLAMVPGALFLLIPPVLVAATGLPFLFLLWLPEVMVRRERARLGVVS